MRTKCKKTVAIATMICAAVSFAEAAQANTYQLIAGNFTWEQACQDAWGRGGHLATITSDEEWSQIVGMVRNSGEMNHFRFWVGANRIGDGNTYHWIDEDADVALTDDNPYWLVDSGAGIKEPSRTDPTQTPPNTEEYVNLIYYQDTDRYCLNDVPNDLIAVDSYSSGKVGYILEIEQ